MKKLVVLLSAVLGWVACGEEFTTPLFPDTTVGGGGQGGPSTSSGGAGGGGSSQGGQAGEGGETTGGGGSGGDAGNTSSGGGGGIGGVAGDAGHGGDAGQAGEAGQGGDAGAGQGGDGGQAGAGQAGQGGAGGQGGSDPPCSDKEKYCGFVCVSKSDPAYGCADNNCQPCAKLDHASVGCNLNGQCAVSACDQGYKNCNAQDPDGCEVNTQNDPANCGACKNACSLTHAQAKCNVGVCEIAQCDAGFDNCNGQHPDGCEVSLKDDPANCGACKNACSSKACEASKCNPLCGPGEKVVSTVGVSLCWEISQMDKHDGKYLGLGGLANQPNKPDVIAKPFPGCVAGSKDDLQVVCKLDVEKGTYLQMELNAYNDSLGKGFYTFLCDESQYPTAKCKGTMRIYRDGVEVVAPPFSHPPKPPWNYVVAEGRFQLAVTVP